MTASEIKAACEKHFTFVLMDVPALAPTLALLQHEIAREHPTAWTNGQYIRVNPDFIRRLLTESTDGATLRGVYLHEAWHWALQHPWRGTTLAGTQGGFDWDLWNEACDHEVNLAIVETNDIRPFAPRLPEGAIMDRRFRGMAAEQIYAILKAERGVGNGNRPDPQGPGGQSGSGSTAGQPGAGAEVKPSDDATGKPGAGAGAPGKPGRIGDFAPPPAERAQALREDFTRALLAAKAIGSLPAGLERFFDRLLNPQVPWTEVLRHLATQVSRDDYSWMRPHPAYLAQRVYFPSLHTERLGDVVCVRDTSGSISARELAAMTGEALSVLEDLQPRRLILVDCDAAVQRWEEYTPGDTLDPRSKGGGGTCCRPVFERLEAEGITPEVLVYFTDMEIGDLHQVSDPSFPVIWCVYGNPGKHAVFGQTLHLPPA